MSAKSDGNTKRLQNWFLRCLVASLSLFGSDIVLPQSTTTPCGSLMVEWHDPYDYLNPADQERLKALETHHFTREVENLIGHDKRLGNRVGLADDIDFTLRYYPNHYRALMSMINYHLRGYDKTDRPMRYTPECYFDRALRWRPNDSVLHMIFGYYYYKTGQVDDALEKYLDALELAPNSSEVHYNLGLLYVDLGKFSLASEHAKTAYSLGYPLPGLRDKLQRAGHWEAPEAVAEEGSK